MLYNKKINSKVAFKKFRPKIWKTDVRLIILDLYKNK